MSRLATKRIQNELAAMQNDPPPGCVLGEMGDDIFRWNVEIQGPPDSPYEGGTYALLVTFPRDYPFKPPTVKFETRIFHPNINMTGDICLDTLSSQWAAGISMAQVLLSIIALLSDPNPSDPINLEAARVLRNDPDTYNRMVRSMVARQRDLLPGGVAVVGGGRVGGVRRVPRVRRIGRGSVDNRAGEMADRHGRGAGTDDEEEGEAADDGVAEEVVDDGVNNEEGDLDGQEPAGGRVGQGQDEEEGEDLAQQGNGQEEPAQEGAEDWEEDSSQEGDCVNVNVNDGVNVNVNDAFNVNDSVNVNVNDGVNVNVNVNDSVNVNVDVFAPEGDAGEDHDENGGEDFAQEEHE